MTSLPPATNGSSGSPTSDEKYRALKRRFRELLANTDYLAVKLRKTRSKVKRLRRGREQLIERLLHYESATSSSSDDNETCDTLSSRGNSDESGTDDDVRSSRKVGRASSASDSESERHGGASDPDAHPPKRARYAQNRPSKLSASTTAPAASAPAASTAASTPAKSAAASRPTKEVKKRASNTAARKSASAKAKADATNEPSATGAAALKTEPAAKAASATGPLTIASVPRDIATGLPALPLQLTPQSILIALGAVRSQPGYCTADTLYPVGYTASRIFPSMYADTMAVYTCEVLEPAAGGAAGDGPRFVVTPSDMPPADVATPQLLHSQIPATVPIIAASPAAAWDAVTRAVAAMRGPDPLTPPPPSGPDAFGFTNPVVRHLVQELEGARACVAHGYMWRTIVEDDAQPSGSAATAIPLPAPTASAGTGHVAPVVMATAPATDAPTPTAATDTTPASETGMEDEMDEIIE
ncbi:hypothetical protein CXG81DRAFT_23914 [Caulochytrium protostelioides]|uniref:FYR N-terminal domain-containing protein n=1 Tax=Caulochytrium protostelioides TaxID=1555241 RepID=A0A4P9XDG4_9FUNG|nr:hypothetical protein CXG81DRAFT_23914 [Caulochytrium protostelioides]|eukprot:RKP03515.1 hypothetical protein CXG81DRAFT_23914 [Caulochytrium protostelioides]